MNIGVTTFGGDGGKSGISRYIIRLLQEFAGATADHRYEVYVYEDERALFLPASSRMHALCFAGKLRRPLMNIAWHQLALSRWCRRRKHDVVFLPAGNRRLPISVPCPSVGTVHDFSSLHVVGKYDPARMFYIKRVLPLLVRRLTRVLTVSESSKCDIVDYAGVPPERVTVTPLAADAALYHPRDKGASARLVEERYGVRPPYVLFISRIEHPGKNHARLIRAFDRAKSDSGLPHQLLLAGGDWMRADEVHRVASEAGCSDDIVFTGFAPDADLPDLYCGADLFVFPSLYEGFGLPVLEAMSCGVPVACSDLSSMPEVAGDAGLLFDPYDEEAIAEAIRRLLTDSALRERCARLGIERSKQFTWAATAQRTLDVLGAAADEAG